MGIRFRLSRVGVLAISAFAAWHPSAASGAFDTSSPRFSFVCIPDSQDIVNYARMDLARDQVQWIKDHADPQNVACIAHNGDIINLPTTLRNIDLPPLFDKLDSGVRQWVSMNLVYMRLNTETTIPWGTATGNHDGEGDSNYDLGVNFDDYNQWFGEAWFTDKPWYLGSNAVHSSLVAFRAAGREFQTINLGFQLDWTSTEGASAIQFAQACINAHPNRPTILNVHKGLNDTNRWPEFQVLWDNFIKHNPQIFLVVSGHSGVSRRVDNNDYGQPVYQCTADYQQDSYPFGAMLRSYNFDETSGTIVATTVQADTGAALSDDANQFSLSPSSLNRLQHPAWNPPPIF